MTRLFAILPFRRQGLRVLMASVLATVSVSALAAEPITAGQGKLESVLAQDLAQRTGLDSRRVQPRALTDATLLPASRVAISLGQVQPLAILPVGSTISHAEQLQGRAVCLAQAGGYAGLLQARFGAQEQTFPSLSAALAALQAGNCDALVHDGSVLQALVRLPEWQRFGKSIVVGEPRQLAVVLPASDSAAIAKLRQTAREWQASAHADALAGELALRAADEVRRGRSLVGAQASLPN